MGGLGETSIRDIQLVELKLLLELDRICKMLSIPYAIYFGTLLGAVRYKGFIPWDDDIDVVMIREDYERFLREAPSVLAEEYFLQTTDTDPEYPRTYAKIRDSSTTYIETYFADRKMNHGINIDVFPLDGVPNNGVLRLLGWVLISAIGQPTFLRALNIKSPPMFNILRGFGKFIPLSDQFLIKLYSKLITFMGSERWEFVAHSSFPAIAIHKLVYRKSWIKDTIPMEFEGHMFPAPREYANILTGVYGDYMTPPPECKREPNHLVEIVSVHFPYTDVENDEL